MTANTQITNIRLLLDDLLKLPNNLTSHDIFRDMYVYPEDRFVELWMYITFLTTHHISDIPKPLLSKLNNNLYDSDIKVYRFDSSHLIRVFTDTIEEYINNGELKNPNHYEHYKDFIIFAQEFYNTDDSWLYTPSIKFECDKEFYHIAEKLSLISNGYTIEY